MEESKERIVVLTFKESEFMSLLAMVLVAQLIRRCECPGCKGVFKVLAEANAALYGPRKEFDA